MGCKALRSGVGRETRQPPLPSSFLPQGRGARGANGGRVAGSWYRGWDSNPHDRSPGILSPVRLPFRHPGSRRAALAPSAAHAVVGRFRLRGTKTLTPTLSPRRGEERAVPARGTGTGRPLTPTLSPRREKTKTPHPTLSHGERGKATACSRIGARTKATHCRSC